MGKSKKKNRQPPLGAEKGRTDKEQNLNDWKKLSESFINIVGTTPLMLAALSEDLKFFKELMEINSNLKATSRRFGLTLVHFAAMNEAHGKELINFLVSEKHLNPNEGDCQGETPIVYAIREKRFENAKELIKYWCQSASLLEYAIFELVDIEIAKSVLKHDRGDMKITTAMVVKNTNVEMFKLLLKNNILRLNDISSECFYATAMNRSKEIGVDFVRYFAEIWKAGPAKILALKEKDYFGYIEFALMQHNEGVADELYAQKQVFGIENTTLFPVREKFGEFLTGNDLSGVKFLFSKHHEELKELGNPAIRAAALHGDLEMNTWLWSVFTPTETLDWNPQISAAYNDEFGHELVPFFLSRGYNLLGEKNDSPLYVALLNGNAQTAEVFIEHGAQLEREDSVNLMIHNIIERDEKSIKVLNKIDKSLANVAARHAADYEQLEWMYSSGLFDIHEKTDKKQSYLHLAVLENCRHPKEVFPFLVSLGLDVNERDNCGKTPLHYALLGDQNVEFARILLDLNADINVKINQESLLHLSAYRNKLKSAIFLLNTPVFNLIIAVNMVGETALHIAARWADFVFCKFLVEKGIDVNAKNKFGLTALDCVPLKSVEDDQNEKKRIYLRSKMRAPDPAVLFAAPFGDCADSVPKKTTT